MNTNLLSQQVGTTQDQSRTAWNTTRIRLAVSSQESDGAESSFRTLFQRNTVSTRPLPRSVEARVETFAQSTSTPTPSSAKAPLDESETVTIAHTPFGDMVIKPISVATMEKAWEPKSFYFYTHLPQEYRDDPQKMAEFGKIYGARALSVLKQFGTVPENQSYGLLSTAEQKAFFREDGVRTYYTVSNLINMMPSDRAKVVDVSTDQLLNLYWNGNYDVKFQTKASATV